jgi:phenylpropionate dioxygenase-like ring-hydroxylating dioxygenase large terminal subunit
MLREHWDIACAASRLQAAPRAVKVLDDELVVFRDASGRPQALLDRCCHRGAPLSMGRVVDGTLACAYHGWQFDGSGRCVHIPSLVEGRPVPRGCGVPAYPCVEQDGYVWVWTGAAQPPSPPQAIDGLAQRPWVQGSRERRCASVRSLENSLDWCHPAFVHAGNHPQSQRIEERGFEEHAYEMRLLAGGMTVFAPPTAGDGEPVPHDVHVAVSFQLPDRVTVHRPQAGVRVVMHFVPTGDGTCRMEWLLHHPGLTGTGVAWSDEEGQIFEQDRIILEACQRQYDQAREPFEQSVEADACTLMLRRIVQLAHEGRWETERHALRQRRVVPVRG